MATRRIKLQDVCRALDVPERDVRYVLERGFVPAGVPEAPGSGQHRDFSPQQAFWLGMVLKLKRCGLGTPLAAQVADYADEALRGVTQNLNWEWRFLPRAGQFDTEHEYYVDVADLEHIRLATDACPSSEGLYVFPWQSLKKPRRVVRDVSPFVVLRLDLSLIAARLGAAFGSVAAP